MKTDFDLKMREETTSLNGEKPRLLLHACCAPCASSVLEWVTQFFKVTLFYYNPNTMPLEEFHKRGGEFKKLLSGLGLENSVEFIYPQWENEKFLDCAKGLENQPEGGLRCPECFNLRLSKTALFAKENGFDYFTTTLTVSPHKNAQLINRIGEELSKEHGIKWLFSDFKKKDGYLRSIRISESLGIYRQNYCGCSFSKEFSDK